MLPTPHFGPQPMPSFKPPRPPHPTLPLVVAAVAVVLIAAPLAGSSLIADVLDRWDLPLVAYVSIAVSLTYGPALIWWWIASKTKGTGHLRRDAGVIARVPDLWWGPLTWIGCFVAQAAMAMVVIGLKIPFTSNVDDLSGDNVATDYMVMLIVLTVVVAPIAEEIIFRGLVMRGLLRVMPPVAAIGLQAVLFGAAHIDPARGSGNLGLVMVLSAVGGVLGAAAYLHRRLTSSMVAHAFINAIAVSIALWGPDIGRSLNATLW